ncbi:mucin-19-like [Erpetoichthys calabaricus]|uniref:mucin-19-like n=1 Tax=Erpetoichthys calabaricus TaxID=27687 RepID=UPI002234284D|nr:mucin-19-like [Erpetoichthys calabaricus]
MRCICLNPWPNIMRHLVALILLGVFLITDVTASSPDAAVTFHAVSPDSGGINYDECSAYGTGSFRTFNGTLYYLQSTCFLVLSRFNSLNPNSEFDIKIQRDLNGNFKKIKITVDKLDTVIENGVISVDGQSVSLPYDQKSIHIHHYGIFVRLESRRNFLSVYWEPQGDNIVKIWVQLRSDYRGKTVGLCGNYDINDNSRAELLQQSRVPGSADCEIPDNPEDCDKTKSICNDAMSKYFFTYCFMNDQTLYEGYIEQCGLDSCNCADAAHCQCAFYEELTRQCPTANLIDLSETHWREDTKCDIPTCPENMTFTEVGPANPPTCSNPSPSNTAETKTCACPEGTILDDLSGQNNCIEKEQCPCEYNGAVYQTGQTHEAFCELCECHSGKWVCKQNDCPSQCKIEVGSSITTFDGKVYTVNGNCDYVIAMDTKETWILTAELSDCDQNRCLTQVQLSLNLTIYTFLNNRITDGTNIITKNYNSDDVTIIWQSSQYVQVQTAFGMNLQIQVAPVMQLYVILPVDAQGSTKGLCGNFNGIVTDEFMASSGIMESTADAFAKSWATNTECEPPSPIPCIRSDNEKYANEKCALLKDPNGVFARCHSLVNYDSYIKSCITSTCNCDNVNQCLCTAFENYAKECSRKGLHMTGWRRDQCVPECPINQNFSYNIVSCNSTCSSLSGNDISCNMNVNPVEGCGCLEGLYMNDEGKCVSKIECPCYSNGKIVNPGKTTINGQECNCENGVLQCTPPRICNNNKAYINCWNNTAIPSEKSCSGSSLPTIYTTCVSGCYCVDGYYKDDTGNCVPLDQCPCKYGNKVYSPGESVQNDCNTCTCNKGTWSCTHRDCQKKCQVYGDGHYQTFDTQWYSFDGNCEYSFVEDYCGESNGTFRITVESVPCCEEALTCSRSVKITLQGKEIELKDLKIEEKTTDSSVQQIDYSVHTVGLYLIITFSNNITVMWDKHTRVTVTLQSNWMNKVCGLCGNFDGNSANDLQTRMNSVVTNTLEFGNSWKMERCSNVVNQSFPCEKHWYCSAWAQRRCSIIKDTIFQECHSKVDPQPYYDVCVQESCVCEMEGRYLGFCTAVAAYAEACNEANVCVDWRTPDLCPVYCDYYNEPDGYSWHYEPCGSLPVKTCSKNTVKEFHSSKLEGCYAKCTNEESYLDENTMKCTTLETCTCIYNGIIAIPGQVIKINESEHCICTNGQMVCHASTTTPSTGSTTTSAVTTSPVSVTTTTAPVTPTESTASPASTTTPSTGSTTTSAVTTSPVSVTTTTAPVTPTESTASPASTTTPSTGSTTTSAVTTSPVSVTTTTAPVTPTESTASPASTTTPSTVSTTTSAVSTRSTESTASTVPIITGPKTTVHTAAQISTTRLVPPCSGHWTDWINNNHPSVSNGGDSEDVKGLCQNGVENIQCQSLHPEYHNENVTCNIQQGLICRNNDQPSGSSMSICADYEIRACCYSITSTTTTTTTTTVSTTSTTHTQTVTSVSATRPTCTCIFENNTFQCGTSWFANCANNTCISSNTIHSTPVVCPSNPKPKCASGLEPSLIQTGCCSTWDCGCACQVFGDPHYITFSGAKYAFLEDCTYILVQEKAPVYGFKVMVDNYYCAKGASCAKGIIVTFRNNTVNLTLNNVNSKGDVKILSTFNTKAVMTPFKQFGIDVQSTGNLVRVFISEISTQISLNIYQEININVPLLYFGNKTEGQCGECGGKSCLRRNGTAEPDECCTSTASDWITSDPAKKNCVAKHQSCPTPTPPPIPPPVPPPCTVLTKSIFEECAKTIDLKPYITACIFDQTYTNSSDVLCSSISGAADQCKMAGICVEWRPHLNGLCDMNCDNGTVFNECGLYADNYCQAGQKINGSSLGGMTAGCFCPDHMMRAEIYKDVCVSKCPNCKGPLGEPKMIGEMWESNCHICTCDEVTLTEICTPKVCPVVNCKEDEISVPDTCGCCNTCVPQVCQATVSNQTVTVGKCSGEFEVGTCRGQCPSWTSFSTSSGNMESTCKCCQALETETRSVSLTCSNKTSKIYTYTSTKSCSCSICSKNNDYNSTSK